jgi:MFS family permease
MLASTRRLRMDQSRSSDPLLPDPRRDLLLLYAARAARNFGDGFAVIVLPAYLSAIGYTPGEIGLVATAALSGAALLTLSVGWLAPRFDLRGLLIAGAFLMAATGLAMSNAQHLALIMVVAFIGTMNMATGDLGVLVPIEHAMLAREATDDTRTSVFARYSLIGAFASAAGALAAATPDLLRHAGLAEVPALQAMLYLYAALGLAGAVCYRFLPRARPDPDAPKQAPPAHVPAKWFPVRRKEHAPIALGPSRGIVYKLAALFSVDAFAGGFTVQSLMALWLLERFGMSLAAASVFFFWSSVLAALSFPAAARLAARFGLVNTMVFTHIPSSICLIVAAFVPNLYAVLALLLVRSALSQMDVPTRTSYVMAVVTPAERPAAASVTAVPRSLAASVSPAFAGVLYGLPFSALPLVLCGALKIAYDVALLVSFRHIKPPEEQQAVARS